MVIFRALWAIFLCGMVFPTGVFGQTPEMSETAAAEITPQQLNQAFQVELWGTVPLWEDEIGAVAGRLKWPQ